MQQTNKQTNEPIATRNKHLHLYPGSVHNLLSLNECILRSWMVRTRIGMGKRWHIHGSIGLVTFECGCEWTGVLAVSIVQL